MSEQERPDTGAMDPKMVDKKFGDPILSDAEITRQHQEDVQADTRRKGTIKRGLKKAAAVAGIGVVGVAGGREVLQSMDGKPLGSLAQPPEKQIKAQTQEHMQDARAAEAIARAKANAEAGKPAPQSGVIEVSEAGTTGYVDLDNPNPEDTTTVNGTGGVSAEAEPGTGGISPKSTS